MKNLVSGGMATLSAAVFLATAVPRSDNENVKVQDPVQTNGDYETASVSIGFRITGDSLYIYKDLEPREHDEADWDLWYEIWSSIGEHRKEKYKTYDDAPEHHTAHQNSAAVREWLRRKDILPYNPHELEEDPDDVTYRIVDGVEVCEHNYGVEGDSPFIVHTSRARVFPRIGARVFVTVRWVTDPHAH